MFNVLMLGTTSIEKFEFKSDHAGTPGLMAFVVDWPRGTIRCLSSGFWSCDQAKRHFEAYVSCVREIHRRGTPAYIVVDLRTAAAQSQQVTTILHDAVEGLYKPGDRIAMVMGNSVAKMQMRRLLQPEYHEFFLSLNAAEKWVFTH